MNKAKRSFWVRVKGFVRWLWRHRSFQQRSYWKMHGKALECWGNWESVPQQVKDEILRLSRCTYYYEVLEPRFRELCLAKRESTERQN
jgi:hypothetical protein